MASSFVIQSNALACGVSGSSKRDGSEMVESSSRISSARSSGVRLHGKVGEAVGMKVGAVVVGDGVGTSSRGVGSGVGLGVGPGVGLGVGSGVGLGVGPGVGLGVGPGVGLGVGPDVSGTAVGLGVGPGVSGTSVGKGVDTGLGAIGLFVDRLVGGGVGSGVNDDCNDRVQKPTSSAVMSN